MASCTAAGAPGCKGSASSLALAVIPVNRSEAAVDRVWRVLDWLRESAGAAFAFAWPWPPGNTSCFD